MSVNTEGAGRSPLPGFAALSRKELLEATRSRRMPVFLLLMTFVVVLVPLIGYARIDAFNDGFRHVIRPASMEGMVAAWAGIVAYLGSLLVIAATVDAVSNERSLGVAGWIVTKPVSRAAYLASKAAMHALTATAVVVIIPGTIWLILTVLLFEDVPMARILFAALVLCVEMLFLSLLTVSLGVPFRSVVWIAVIALAVWFLPTIVPVIALVEWAPYVIPSYLPFAAILAATGDETRFVISVTLSALVIGIVVFAAAVSLFEQQEI